VRARREAVTKEKQEREDVMTVEKKERKNAVAAALRQCVVDTSTAFRRELNAVLHVCNLLYRRQAHPHVLSPHTPWCCTTLRGVVPQSSAWWTMTHIVRYEVIFCAHALPCTQTVTVKENLTENEGSQAEIFYFKQK